MTIWPSATGSVDLVVEEQLAVLGQRPQVVGDEGLQLVGDGPQRVLCRDHMVDEATRLFLHGAGRVRRGMNSVIEIVDRRAQAIGQRSTRAASAATAVDADPTAGNWPR